MDPFMRQRLSDGMPNQELIKCPVCNKVIRPWKVGRRPICRHVSHNCLEIWLPAPCPICLEDVVPPPNIALPCGHVVCHEDFKLMGGKLQDRMEDNGDESEEEEPDYPQGFNEMVRRSGLDEEMLRRMTRSGGDAAIGMDDSDDYDEYDDDHYDDDDDDDDDDDSHESMPRMVLDPRVDSGFFRHDVADHTDSSDDSEPPPLIARRERSNSDDDSLTGLIQQRVYESAPPADRNAAAQSVPSATDASHLARGFLSGSGPHLVNQPQPQTNTTRDVVYCMRRDDNPQVWEVAERGIRRLERLDLSQNETSLVKSATGFAFLTTRGSQPLVANYSADGDLLSRYFIDSNVQDVQVVVDELGFWTLGPIAGAIDASMLKYYGNQFPNGKPIRRVSSQSTLYRGSNSCWVHVQRRTADIDSGLWFFKTNGQKHTLRASDISPHALIAPNVDKSVWVMQRAQSQTTLRRVGMNGRSSSEATLDCECTRQSSLITTARGGVYIHTRQARQWSLFVYENNVLRRLTDGHPDARLAVDRNGSAWILKRSTSPPHHLRLFKVDSLNNAIVEIGGRFDDIVSLTGAF